MGDLLNRLLGFNTLRPGEPGVHFAFTYELASWQWALLGVIAAVIGWWSYRRLEGRTWWRAVLGVSRALLLIVLAVLAAGPKLVRTSETVEQDWVLSLVDRSGSLRIGDVAGEAGASRRTREEQLRTLLERSSPAWAGLARERTLVWLGFDSGVYPLKQPAASLTNLPVLLDPPTGRRSDLGAAVEQALAKAAARPISGVVIFSDGRATDSVARSVVRRLQAERIPVFTVPLGSADPLSDVAVRSVQGPGVGFVNDVVPVEAVLERTGSTATGAAAKVELVEALTGKVLDEREVTWEPGSAGDDGTRRVTLTGLSPAPGASEWIVRLSPRSADLVTDNNESRLAVQLVDRPLRILYLDGYPRWEYRYVKNLLAREKSITFAALLLSAGRRYLQEGNEDLIALPTSAQEWDRFDVLVMGDVRPEIFTTEQLDQIKRRVLVGGAGMLWIGGPGATPTAWRSTPLADLLPMTLGRADALAGPPSVRAWDQDVVMRPTPLADRLGVLRLLEQPVDGSWWPSAVSDPASGWSRLRWAQRIDASALKPAAEAIALAAPADASGDPTPSPLVMTMRYGAGRILYVATDETWRWRYGRGEDLPERFWLQMLRLLGREAVARAGKPALLEVTPRQSEVGQPVRVSVELLDQQLLDANPAGIAVRLTRTGEATRGAPGTPSPGGDASQAVIDVVLRPTGEPRTARGERRVFAATWIPAQTGTYKATVTDPLLAGRSITADAEVWLPDDELRRPEADHPLLAQLSRDTGGAVLQPADLDRLGDFLPRREVRVTGVSQEQSLWDTPLALAILVLLLTLEWVGRRLIRLS